MEVDWTGHEAFFINATDTVLTVPTEEAIAGAYPGVEVRSPLPGFASAISVEKAQGLVEVGPASDVANGLMRDRARYVSFRFERSFGSSRSSR